MLYYKQKRLFEGMWPDPLPQAYVCRLKIVHHHYPSLHGSLYFIEKINCPKARELKIYGTGQVHLEDPTCRLAKFGLSVADIRNGKREYIT
jgi:hypothetical protein